MKLLLDTHALIWFTTNDPRLPASLAARFLNSDTALYVSRISLLEMAIKSPLNKPDYPIIFDQWLHRFQQFDFELLEITDAHLLRLSQLPPVKNHRDPFDRLLIAQALTEDLTLVSRDGKFGDYAGLKLQWT
ncbi:MAG: type II toxin-antitoxin system VapC family toxin [Janthinobacterium lividum]